MKFWFCNKIDSKIIKEFVTKYTAEPVHSRGILSACRNAICELDRNSRHDFISSENRTTEISAGKEILVIVSTLIVEKASPGKHAGNYSCMVPGKAKTTIAVHVLNGEYVLYVHTCAVVTAFPSRPSWEKRERFRRHIGRYLSKRNVGFSVPVQKTSKICMSVTD